VIEDYQKLIDQIQLLINTPDLDPETFLGFERKEAHLTRLSAPYRLDCALTYRLPGAERPNSAPLERVKRELSTAEWAALINKAFAAGIPHVVFTGGEPTLRDDLVELIGQVEANGQVAGLITDGQRLNEPGYLEQLLAKGLDHLMVVLNPEDPGAWKILESILVADIFLAVHLTLTPENTKELPGVIDRLAAMGVKAISLSSMNPELKHDLENARNLVAARQVELVWNLPVPYSALHPVAMETTEWSALPGAGKHWLYVEPDGDVLPAQGLNQVLGNLAQQTWEEVWKQ
jgi:MoaA/NifB/PqqE/SkfB family radical SAM enzyme